MDICCNYCKKPIKRRSELILGNNQQIFLGKGNDGMAFFFVPDTPYHLTCYMIEREEISELLKTHKHLKLETLPKSLAGFTGNPLASPAGIFNMWMAGIFVFLYAIFLINQPGIHETTFQALMVYSGFFLVASVKIRAWRKFERYVPKG